MTKMSVTTTALLLIIGNVAYAQDVAPSVADTVIKILSEKDKRITWDKSTIIEVDINCDDNMDYAATGLISDDFAVGLVTGPLTPNSNAYLVGLAIGKGSQDSLCKLPAKLEKESLDYDDEPDGYQLPGFRQSTKCFGFEIRDNECDTFHFYWNHDAKTLDWWRF